MSEVRKSQGKKNTHKHKQLWGIVPGLGGRPSFFYVFGGGHLRPVVIKPVGRIFEISDSNPIGEDAENAETPLTPEKQGSEEIPQSKSAENAENADTKMRKMRMTGFDVTGFR